MKVPTDFLIALSAKLQEIADNTADLETAAELEELIEKIIVSISKSWLSESSECFQKGTGRLEI